MEATMPDRIHSRKFGAAIVGAAIMLLGTSANCYPQTGSIHLTVVKAGFIVSTGSGTGTLDYQGRTYRLSVSSFGFGTIGVSGGVSIAGCAQYDGYYGKGKAPPPVVTKG
jgi:hypothetical protein